MVISFDTFRLTTIVASDGSSMRMSQFYLTNNSAKSREQCAEKLKTKVGVDCSVEQIICSSSSAASYLTDIDFDKSLKVLVVGHEGIHIELQMAGYETIKCGDVAPGKGGGPQCTIPDFEAFELDRGIGAVVAGVDDSFTYSKLCAASLCLQRQSTSVFVATNRDVGDRVGVGESDDGRQIPGAGPIIACLETASGRQAVNVGKGGKWLLPWLTKRFSLESGRTVVVGDRLDTDIALGKDANMLTILPLTGVTSVEQLREAGPNDQPDLVIDSIAALIA